MSLLFVLKAKWDECEENKNEPKKNAQKFVDNRFVWFAVFFFFGVCFLARCSLLANAKVLLLMLLRLLTLMLL